MNSMRISFKSLTRPRRAAKALCELIPGTKLGEAQALIARMCDYDDWAQLKQATEHPDTQASPDDEDLSAEELKARLDFQAQQVRAVLHNTLKQAREIVRLASPTVRSPAAPAAKPVPHRPALQGAAVFMPSLRTRFAPRYPEVFDLLPDVDRLRVDFIQPDENEPLNVHLASDVTLTFANGQTLSLQGPYFWKFLDLMPRELLDSQGAVVHLNPYSEESIEEMLQRLRAAYRYLFTNQPDEVLLREPAPLWIELDLATETLTRRNALGLDDVAKNAFLAVFRRVSEDTAKKLQPVVDSFMVEALNGLRVVRQVVKKGGRGSTMAGIEYVRSSWAGTGHWTMEDLLSELSPEQREPSGRGGNLHYRELFERTLSPHFDAALLSACLESLSVPELRSALCTQLELPPLKGRAAAKAHAQQLANCLLTTSVRLDLKWIFSSAVVHSQGDRTFNTWHSALAVDQSLTRPTVRMDELMAQYRQKT